jgi:hypothetical protein
MTVTANTTRWTWLSTTILSAIVPRSSGSIPKNDRRERWSGRSFPRNEARNLALVLEPIPDFIDDVGLADGAACSSSPVVAVT